MSRGINSEERFRLLFEANPTPMWVYDYETLRIVEVNQSAVKLYGYSREEFLSMTIKELRPPEDIPELISCVHGASKGLTYAGEWRHRKKDGSVITVDIVAGEITFEGRRSRMVLASDVTGPRREQKAQSEARRLLRLILDTVPVRVFWKDREGRLLGCNLPFAKDAGHDAPEELIGKNDFDMSWREQAEIYRADDFWVMETGQSKIGYEEPQTTPQGEKICLRTSKTPLRDANGEIIGVLGTYEDITASKRAEWQLQEREHLFCETQRIAHIGSWRVDLSGAVQWSEETYRIFGVSPDTFTLTLNSFYKLIHPEDVPKAQRWAEEMRAGKNAGDIEVHTTWPDGSVHVISGRGELKYDCQNRPAYLAGTVQDITERKRAEEALQRSEVMLSKSQAIGHIGSWELDLLTKQLIWSDEVFRIFGLRPQEFAYTYDAFLEGVHPEDRKAVTEGYSKSLREGRPGYEIEHRILRRDTGELRVVHEKCEHVKDASGRIIRSVGMVQDITERKRIEDALRQIKEQLALANQDLEKKVSERTSELQENIAELEAFSYTIAHDMRAPLRAILGFSELVRREAEPNLSQTGKDFFNQISNSGRRMDRLIQDILSLSRVSRMQLKLEPVDADKLVRGILASYPAFHHEQAEIEVKGVLPRVQANEAALTQCISNLLSNAVKFVPPGVKPHIEIWATPINTHSVRLWFRDNGIGICPDLQERIFEIFQRIETTYEGTGIGLAIVRKAMHRMGGEVGVESEQGKGSCFWLQFHLPKERSS